MKWFFCGILVVALLAGGCTATSTSLIGQAAVSNRATVGQGPQVRISFPNVRRDTSLGKTWAEAFANVFTSEIVPSVFGVDPITGYIALGGKTAVDLLRSGADAVDDGVFDIDGLATSVKFGEITVGAVETTFKNVDITLDAAGWKPLGAVPEAK